MNLESPIQWARKLQEDHLRSQLDDIGYHFLIGRCGEILEGRGGSYEAALRGTVVRAAHTPGFDTARRYNCHWFGVVLQGCNATAAQTISVSELCLWLCQRATISTDNVRIGLEDAWREVPGICMPLAIDEVREHIARTIHAGLLRSHE